MGNGYQSPTKDGGDQGVAPTPLVCTPQDAQNDFGPNSFLLQGPQFAPPLGDPAANPFGFSPLWAPPSPLLGTPFGPPAPQMGPPAPQMGPPAPQVGPPAPQMGPPAPQVGPPAPQVGPPAPQVGPPAPSTAPAPAVDPQRVRDGAASLFSAMDGWGTDEDKIMSSLRGRSPEEIAAIRAEFANHYGRDLDAMLSDELGGDELAEAQALMSSNRVDATLAGLENSLGFWNDDEAQVEQLMRDLSPDDRARLQQDPRWAEISGQVRDSLGGEDLEVFDALAQGDAATASAIRVDEAIDGWGTDEDAVYANLGNLPPDQRAAVEAAYNQRLTERGEQSNLRTNLEGDLSGADRDRAVAVLDNDVAAEGAARIQQTVEGMGTSEAELFRLLEDQSITPEQRAQRRAAFEQRYGPLGDALSGDLSGTDLERATMAADNEGRLDPAFALFYSMEGMGTDEQLIRDTIRGKTPAEIEALRQSWNNGPLATRFGTDFDAALNEELSGRDHFDVVEIGLLGEPQTPEQMRHVMDLQYEYERGDRAGILGPAAMDFANTIGFSSTAEVLDRNHERMESLFDAQGNLVGTEEQMRELYGWSQQDLEQYRAAKNTVTDAVVTGTEIVVGTLATIATSGAAAPWLAAVIGGLVASGSGMLVRSGMQGDAYGREAIGADALTAVLTAGLSGVGETAKLGTRLDDIARAFGPDTAQALAKSMMKGGLLGAGNGMISGGMNEDAFRAGIGDWLASVGTGGLTGGITGAAGGLASNGTEQLMGNVVDPNTFSGRLITSTTKGLTTETARTATNYQTWQGDADAIWNRFGASALRGMRDVLVSGVEDHYKEPRAQRYQNRALLAADTSDEAMRYRQTLGLNELVRLEQSGVNVDGALAMSDDIGAFEAEIARLQRQAR